MRLLPVRLKEYLQNCKRSWYGLIIVNKTMNATETAVKAMETTRANAADYWNKCLAQRSAYENPCGSTYDLTGLQLECALMASQWEEVSHPSVQAPCRLFKTTLKGWVGIVRLDHLSKNYAITLRDPKGTGEVFPCVKYADVKESYARETSDETYMIAGVENGELMCFTFHPGEPVSLNVVKSEGNDGKVIDVVEALAMGFTYAKVE